MSLHCSGVRSGSSASHGGGEEEIEQLQPVMTDSLAELRRRVSQLGRVVVATFASLGLISSGTGSWTDRLFLFQCGLPTVDPRVPDAYFGNCISASICEANGSDLCHGTDGLIVAAKVVQERMGRFSGVVRPQRWLGLFSERVVTVAGTPTFRF